MSVRQILTGIICDGSTYFTKRGVQDELMRRGHKLVDFGVHWPDASDTIETLSKRASEAVQSSQVDCFVLLDQSGNGFQIAANRHEYVFAAPCFSANSAREAVEVHDANMCNIAGHLPQVLICEIAAAFITSRQRRRVMT